MKHCLTCGVSNTPGEFAELSNPGRVGVDTGHVFVNTRGERIRVIARIGENPQDAVTRVRARHGM